ncbi:MAG: M23 family metallopeptidase, partial [Cyclobacteriaceae bacterium]|nr:M23 family metallopeptidase [Cyclobacteriaceae bacterium]
RYAHLEEIEVSRGQKVAKGKVIGFVGNSGGSVAPHLHYEVIRDGEQVNPLHYLMEGLSGKDYSALIKLSTKQNQSLD